MNNSLKNKIPITDVVTVLTENQFWKLAESNSDIQKGVYVSVAPILPRGGTCARSWTEGLPEGHVAILSDKLDTYYIAFLLNTAPCQTELFEGKINNLTKVRVNKKKISSLEIPVPDGEIQKVYAIAETLFESMMDVENVEESDDRLKYIYKVFEALCNCLAIDLFTYPLLREKGLTLYDDWAKIAIEYNEKKDIEIVMNALTDSDSPLRNDVMKFYLLLEN